MVKKNENIENVENVTEEKELVVDNANNEAKLKKEDMRMKAILDREPKVSIFIPIDELNPDTTQIVAINGVIYSIPKGKEVQVPKPVKEVWEESYNKTMVAKNRIKISNLDVQVLD